MGVVTSELDNASTIRRGPRSEVVIV